MHPGVNALRTPVYPEMINIVNGQQVAFKDYKFDRNNVRSVMQNYYFGNGRPITKSLLAWWAFSREDQELFAWEDRLEIEHIFARKRQEMEKSLNDPTNLESLGNKALLEKRVNIRAADYRFVDKKKYYTGFVTDRGKVKEATNNKELLEMAAQRVDFTEKDIVDRENLIFDSFVDYLEQNDLLQ